MAASRGRRARGGREKRLNFDVSEALAQRFSEAADRCHRSQREILTMLVNHWLDEKTPPTVSNLAEAAEAFND